MWGIFWGICWKSALSWFLVKLALFVTYILFGNEDEDTLSYALLQLWDLIGAIAVLISFFSAIVLIIISIWN